METKEEGKVENELEERIFPIFKDFLTRVAKIEELGASGSRMLSGYQQGLELLRRAPINGKSSGLIDNIIKANETERFKSYMAAGCINNYDRTQNMTKSKSILNELEKLMEDLACAISSSNGSFSPLNEDLCEKFDQQATVDQDDTSLSIAQDLELTDYAALVAIIYSMVKQDYVMQERIVTSLNLRSLPGELESYCLMWSLRPFVNDEVMHRAWRLIH